MADPGGARGGGPLALRYNEVSGNIEMRISNDPNFIGAVWEPMNPDKPWTLADGPAGVYTVFAQFHDGAGNKSYVVHDTIEYVPTTIYLPVINR